VTGSAQETVDARASNWSFAVPSEPAAPLVLVPGGRWPDEALAGPPLPAVVAPDLAGWDRVTGPAPRPAQLLAALCARTAPGGWLCVGFANRWYAGGPLAGGSLGLDQVRRAMARHGLTDTATYIALPDHRHPALLVPARRPAELDHVLRRMLMTYVPASAPFPRLARRTLSALRAVAVRTPHPVRLRLLPGYFVVGRRPP
jgi:hypothetical protein